MFVLPLARVAAGTLLFAACFSAAPAMAAEDASPRLIVKFRSGIAKALQPPRDQVASVAAAAATNLSYRRPMALDAHVITVPGVGNGAVLDAIVARIARLPEVEYVVRSRRRHVQRIPNDTYFPEQYYLMSGSTTIDATSAWDVTTGSPTTVVAVVDTGFRPHADLAGRILPGYDFITETAASNDGDGRDNDASDPGDWFSAADYANPYFPTDECSIESSSWHGTAVSGVVAANSDNGKWLTGVDWRTRILPVRVLGKCGGEDADIIDGIAWAGGLPVPGVPQNSYPAQVINLSLGSEGLCPEPYIEVVQRVLAHGVTRAIVAAAGNDGSQLAQTPAGCDGVISVAATTRSGNRTTYSSYGQRTDLAAPGGDGTKGGTNLLTLNNTGTTVPAADATAFYAGTSFSAPLVSGTVSLMLAVAPALTWQQVRDVLRASARPFAYQTTCTPALCGTGILDAANAVRTAQALAGPVTRVDLVEFYNASLDHYFISWVAAEIAQLDAGTIAGWGRTGKTIAAFSTVQAGTSAVCRIYIPPGKGDGHYYGRDQPECDSTMARNPSFVLEAATFFYLYPAVAGVCSPGQIPVYRVFSNRPDANHRYTTDRAVRDQMVAKGWLAEGDGPDTVVLCAPS